MLENNQQVIIRNDPARIPLNRRRELESAKVS